MRSVRQLLLIAALAALAAPAAASVPAAHYSFADLYRVAVGTPPEVAPAAQASGPAHEYQQHQMRVASTSGAQAAQEGAAAFTYSSSSLPRPSRWLLFLSGLALVAWVARRRLGYSL